jgi:hypothetical protein
LDDEQVTVVERDRFDLDEYLARSRGRAVPVDQLQILTPESGQFPKFHLLIPYRLDSDDFGIKRVLSEKGCT